MSWFGYCSSFASRRSSRVKASAVAPAKPAITPPFEQSADFSGVVLDDGLADRHLAIAGDHDLCRPSCTATIVVPCQVSNVGDWFQRILLQRIKPAFLRKHSAPSLIHDARYVG